MSYSSQIPTLDHSAGSPTFQIMALPRPVSAFANLAPHAPTHLPRHNLSCIVSDESVTQVPALMDFLLQVSEPWIKSERDSQGLLVNLLWSLAWTPTQPGVAELDIKQQSPFTLFFSNLPGFTNPELELGSNMWNASHPSVLPDRGQPETWQFVHRGASITVGLSGPLACLNQSRLHVLTTQPSLHKPIRNAWCPWAL